MYLDENDQKMILVRATNRVMKLAQCGISDKRRFAFYDQVRAIFLGRYKCNLFVRSTLLVWTSSTCSMPRQS